MTSPSPCAFRQQFPTLGRLTHLASCSFGARSKRLETVLSAMPALMKGTEDSWHSFQKEIERARTSFAKLVGAQVSQIAVMPNATTGAYHVGASIDWRRRTGLVTSRAEFPSIAHVWLTQVGRGALVEFADSDDISALQSDYLRRIGPGTGLVSVPMTTYDTGRRMPIADISAAARLAGAKSFVDAYQAVGVEPVDVVQLDCDFLIAGAGKYLLGLPGLAFLYSRDPLNIDLMPALTRRLDRRVPCAFDPTLLNYSGTAAGFETVTSAMPAAFAASAGLDLISKLNLVDVRNHVSGLFVLAAERLLAAGEQVSGAEHPEHHGAHVAVAVDNAANLAEYLTKRHIRVSPWGDIARISFHYYSNTDDIEAVCEGILGYRNGTPRNYTVAALSGNERRFKPALARWSLNPQKTPFPYREVLQPFRRFGKHFVPKKYVLQLTEVQSQIAAQRRARDFGRIDKFLAILLDKHSGVFNYSSYIAYDLLDFPCSSEASLHGNDLDRARDLSFTSLIGDLVRFELAALRQESDFLPHMRVERVQSERRIDLAIAAMARPLKRMGYPSGDTLDNVEARAETLLEFLEKYSSPSQKFAIEHSLVPVFIVHDEYLFLRLLQSFELHFAWIAVLLQRSITSLETKPETAVPFLSHASSVLAESIRLFPLIFDMNSSAFHSFRRFTEGASAIQSVNYKMVESLCCTPSVKRRHSAAYTSVPSVCARIEEGHATIAAALEACLKSDGLSQSPVLGEVQRFESIMDRWRLAHCRLARHYLGTKRGTGYTEGLPYLESARQVPLFGVRETTIFASPGGAPT